MRDEAPAPKGRPNALVVALSAIGGVLLIAVIIMAALLLSDRKGADNARPIADVTTPAPSGSTVPSESPTPSPQASETESPPPSSTPTPSKSPSSKPSTTPSPPTTTPPMTPPMTPAPAGPTFAVFKAPKAASCTSANPTSQITFSWASGDAVRAWFGVHTTNAKNAPYEEVDPTATYTFNFQCSNDSEYYTVTLEDASGNLAHKTVTIASK